MYTVEDYIHYYQDKSIDEVHWNIMDNLICAILVYLPVKSFSLSKNMNELYEMVKDQEGISTSSVMIPRAFDILHLLLKSFRYQNLKVSHFDNIRNENTQFGAATFRIGKTTIISFKGTDGSLIGWMENIRVAYDYPTYTHKLAIEYLKNNINFFDKNIYVVGHSKGGNLAMVSTMESSSKLFHQIKEVDNFDGPGFRKEEFLGENYRKLSKKLVNIIPTGSTVGVLLNNQNYQVIKSNAIAFDEHYPTSWTMFGENFIEGELSSISLQLHEATTSKIEGLSYQKVKDTFEFLFQSFEKEYSSDFKITFNDMINFYHHMKNIDPEIAKYIDIIINSMIGISSNSKEKTEKV